MITFDFYACVIDDSGSPVGVGEDLLPQFQVKEGKMGGGSAAPADDDEATSTLTQYYLKGSVEERKTAQNDQIEFNKALNQMEQEDVPAE